MLQPVYWLCLVVVLALSVPARADVWSNAESLLSQGTAEEAELAFERLARQHPEVSVGVLGERQASFAGLHQQVTLAHRDGDPPLGIQRKRRGSLKMKVRHKNPLTDTIPHCS